MTVCVAILVNDGLVTYSDRLTYDNKVNVRLDLNGKAIEIDKFIENDNVRVLFAGSVGVAEKVIELISKILNLNVLNKPVDILLSISGFFDENDELIPLMQKGLNDFGVAFIFYLKKEKELFRIVYDKQSKKINAECKSILAIGFDSEENEKFLIKSGQAETTSLEKTKTNIRLLHRKLKKDKLVGKNYDVYPK